MPLEAVPANHLTAKRQPGKTFAIKSVVPDKQPINETGGGIDHLNESRVDQPLILAMAKVFYLSLTVSFNQISNISIIPELNIVQTSKEFPHTILHHRLPDKSQSRIAHEPCDNELIRETKKRIIEAEKSPRFVSNQVLQLETFTFQGANYIPLLVRCVFTEYNERPVCAEGWILIGE